MSNCPIYILSDSEEEVCKKDSSTQNLHEYNEKPKKINDSQQKRKSSVSLENKSTPKKSKLIDNKKNIMKNECSLKWTMNSNNLVNIKQFSNVNYSEISTDDENQNSSLGSKKCEKSVQLKESNNKLLVVTKNVNSPNNNTLSKSSTSLESNKVKKYVTPILIVKKKVPIQEYKDDVFENFIKVCKEKRNDSVTMKILDKLEKQYNKVKSSLINNEEFKKFINEKIKSVSVNDQKRFYFYIQEVKSEIKLFSSEIKIQPPEENNSNLINNDITENTESNTDERITAEEENESAYSDLDSYKLKKLNSAIKKCEQRIRELEMEEVDFNDEENSAYVQEDRYKRKLIELYSIRAKIIKDNPIKKEIYKKLLRVADIPSKMTDIKVVDEAIIAFVNASIKKMNKMKHIKDPTAIADFLTVPDYHDIIKCISDCNDKEDLKITDKKIKLLALTAHRSLVNYLKKQRIGESFNYLTSYIENESDPASTNLNLKEKLQKNKQEGDEKLESIFIKYEHKNLFETIENHEASDNSSESDNAINEKNKNNKQMHESGKVKNNSGQSEIFRAKVGTEDKVDSDNIPGDNEKVLLSKDVLQNENKREKFEKIVHVVEEKDLEKNYQDCEAKEEQLSSEGRGEEGLEGKSSEINFAKVGKICATDVSITKEAPSDVDDNNGSIILEERLPRAADDDVDNDKIRENQGNTNENQSEICEQLKHLSGISIMPAGTSCKKTSVRNDIVDDKKASPAKDVKLIEILSDEDEDVTFSKIVLKDEKIMRNEETWRSEAPTSNTIVEDAEDFCEVILEDESAKKDCLPNKTQCLIKVRSFAKPPDSWRDSLSPKKCKEKSPSTNNVQRVVRDKNTGTAKVIDLTAEKPDSSSTIASPRLNTSLAINDHIQKEVMKQLLNNYNMISSNNNVITGNKYMLMRNQNIDPTMQITNVIRKSPGTSNLHHPGSTHYLPVNILTNPMARASIVKKK